MKIIKLLFILILSSSAFAQEMSFSISKEYISQFGKGSDLVGFIPLFELSSDFIHNKQRSLKIKNLSKSINKANTAYGFIYFTGLSNSLFDNEIALLVENYRAINPIIYIDRNGNLDFNDDGAPLVLKNNLNLKLSNEDANSAYYKYQIAKSKVSLENESRLRNRYASRFPKSSILTANNWLTSRRLSVRISKEKINANPITILLIDNSVDGLFTFQTDQYGDRILIIEGEIDENKGLTALLRQAEPIDHNAVFELYGKNYYVKAISKNGDELTISVTNQDTRVMFKDGHDISNFVINLLDGTTTRVKDLIKEKKYLLIDVGGTWCGGCIKQEPTIKKLYESGKVEVIGLFDFDTAQSVREYVKKHNLKWPVALVDSSFKDMFRVVSFPTYILVSPEGKIILTDSNSEQIVEYLRN